VHALGQQTTATPAPTADREEFGDMVIKIDGQGVNVADVDCAFRSCFALGFDKGSFTPGVGYTEYHAGGVKPVCWTRHLNGCPHKDPTEGVKKIYPDGSVLVALPDPNPCCGVPSVARNPSARSQRCRSCQQALTGARLEMARGTWATSQIKAKRVGDRWEHA